MGLIFCDSFDHYAYADILKKWSSLSDSDDQSGIGSSYGRLGTKGLRMGHSGYSSSAQEFVRLLAASVTTATVGAAVRPGSIGQKSVLFGFRHGSTIQVRLHMSAASPGRLALSRGGNFYDPVYNGATSYATSDIGLDAGTWYFVELQVKSFHSTAGSVEVRVNGVADASLTLTNANTDMAGTGHADTLILGGGGLANQHFVDCDDLYVRDDTTFMGDIRVSALYPTGAGAHADFTRGATDSGANWSQVDETAPNSDTDFNASADVGNIDSFAMGNIGQTAATILGVQTNIFARKTDAGTRNLAPFERSGTTETPGTGVPLSTAYTYQRATADVNPATGIAYTLAEINALEVGYKLTA